MAHYKIKKLSPNGKAPASNLQKKGSITLEAAAVISIFFLGIICLTYLFEIMVLQTTIANGLHAVGKELAVESYANPIFIPSQIEKKLIEEIGSHRLDNSIVAGGSAGLDCDESKKYRNTSIMDLSVSYQVEIPILMFRIPLLRQEEVLRIKGWTGYEGNGGAGTQEDTVYITEHGLVYHNDRDCTYLDLSVKTAAPDKVADLRNESGGRYYACTYCGGKSEKQLVYITSYGTRYHSTLDCSRIKRKVYEIPRKQAYGIGGCSKCVK